KDLCRGVINQRIGRIRRMFRWATENEHVPVTVYQALMAVRGLTRGRHRVRETEPVKPVADKHVNAVLPHVSRHVAAMIQIQRLTGMRPGEVAGMHAAAIDRSKKIWLYRLTDHKNSWRGHSRIVPLGKKAQELIKPFLSSNKTGYLFSPKVAMAEL